MVKVTKPLLGADFLCANNLLLDMKNRRPINAEDFGSFPCILSGLPTMMLSCGLTALVRGYYQVAVRPEDVPNTAVITPFRLFEFLRMPFGLNNPAQAFQRLMDSVLRDVTFIFVYLDNILVTSECKAEHLSHLRTLYECLSQHGLIVNPAKCQFGLPSIDFLGHHITKNGTIPLPSKVAAVSHFPQPHTTRALQEFLAMVNFYHHFIPCAASSPWWTGPPGDWRPFCWHADMVWAFIGTWVSRFGVPSDLSSDRSPQFTSELWSKVAQSLGVTLHNCIPPAGDFIPKASIPWSASLQHSTHLSRAEAFVPVPTSRHGLPQSRVPANLCTVEFNFVRHSTHQGQLQSPYDTSPWTISSPPGPGLPCWACPAPAAGLPPDSQISNPAMIAHWGFGALTCSCPGSPEPVWLCYPGPSPVCNASFCMLCCGDDYVNGSSTVCCRAQDGASRTHPVGNGTESVKCCGTDLIRQDEACCNGAKYDPHKFVCAERPSPGLTMQEDCRPSALCPIAAAAGAYCGTCRFRPTESICTRVRTPPSPTPSAPPPPAPQTPGSHLCPSPEDIVYMGPATQYTFTDTGLDPHTSYEYRVGVWNGYGRGFSPFVRVTTMEDVPWGLSTPRWRLGDRSDAIQLDWQMPTKPNGEISRYVVLRNGQERYTGMESSFMDVGGIGPFQEYVYQLRACTSAGCSDSSQVVAVTVQGVPESVPSPVVSVLGPRALQLSWAPPAKPNGIVREYRLNQSGAGLVFAHSSGAMRHTLTGLQPHTEYSFLLIACTSVGCGVSQPSMGRTLQDAPAGVWAQPRHVVVNSSTVELYWSEPLQPNGLVSRYRLLRDGVLIFSSDSRSLNHTDAGLEPNSRYVYVLEASTGGGSGRSDGYVIHTPAASPERVPAPYNITITGPRSVFVAWTPPEVFNTSLPLEYNVLLNAGSEQALIWAAGGSHFLLVEGLEPVTGYRIRIQACQQGNCGVGEWVYAQTSEAPPEHLDPPTVTAAGPTVIDVRWTPPHKPRGLITAYFIHRRPVGAQEELLVFVWSQGPLEFTDASDALRPFSRYEYRVRAQNSRGSTHSAWASTLTMEAEPEGMATPTTTPTSAYSVRLDWTGPGRPNGIISQYRLVYQRQQSDPTLHTSSITALTVPVRALHHYSGEG
ncbi:hypothetical protein AAFF_G00396970 [Aldrovandia affinis]|uniref:ribonuclease H n=1 Tax=Aldrovandia affinis TaxID=143900 RepID=A0AAD7SD03_9TELE|nr:hypothetical protein AAFF_G00396970 [Aldrovandia affinis]